MPKEIVLASHNKKKMRELAALFAPLAITVRSLADFPQALPPEENGATFEENAAIKAVYAREVTGLSAVADDSGLMVDALDGAPGVYSARFAGDDADDAANNRLLLERLAGVPPEKRGARFVSAVVLADAAGGEMVFRGETAGVILDAPRGENGFGYDPLFFSDDLGKTFAEAFDAEKNAVSHRGRAVAALAAYLRSR